MNRLAVTPLWILWLSASCASYRVLPVPPPRGGLEPVDLKVERTRALLFKSVDDDVAVERVFQSPVDRSLLIATVARPDLGAMASRDGGREWTMAKIGDDEPGGDDARVLRGPFATSVFRDMLFDPSDGKVLYGRTAVRLWRSEDAGQSFTPFGGRFEGANGLVEAAAVGADGALYLASNGRLAVSKDHGHSFRRVPLPTDPQPGPSDLPRLHVRSIAADPVQPHSIYVSLGAQKAQPLWVRVRGLLDRTSEEALAALDVVTPRPESPRGYSFGEKREGVYATQDGGTLWTKTALSVESYLYAQQGALVAVAADPLLEVAALARRYPALAVAASAQVHGAGVDANALKAACKFPGRDRLLAGALGAAVVFLSKDAGASWVRIGELLPADAPVASDAINRQHLAWLDAMPRKPERRRSNDRPPPGYGQNPYGWQGAGVRGRPPPTQPLPDQGPEILPQGPPRVSLMPVSAIVSLFDPLRLLARFNGGLALAGIARAADGTQHAYAATESQWNALAASLAAASEAEGEMSIGPGVPIAPPQGGAFELLRSTDGGAHFVPAPYDAKALDPDGSLARQGLVPYPTSVTAAAGQTLLPLAARDRAGKRWQKLWRLAQ